jgi:hypothetical protein
MMHFGGSYVLHAGHGLTLKENWLTRGCAPDMQMSCHFAVNLIRLFRDKFPDLPCPLDQVGSDCCEDQFLMLGQETRNMHNFTFAEAAQRTAHIARIEQIKGKKDGPLFVKSRRRENLWHLGGQHEPSSHMCDYPSDLQCCEAWDGGLTWAREVCKGLGMRPVLEQKGKWAAPGPASFQENMQVTELLDEEADDDGQEPAPTRAAAAVSTLLASSADANAPPAGRTDADAPPAGSADEGAGPSQGPGAGLADVVRDSHAHVHQVNAITDLADIRGAMLVAAQSLEDQHLDDRPGQSVPVTVGSSEEASTSSAAVASSELWHEKHPATVEVPGHGSVYKMRLVSQLNATPHHVPLDRLRRVRVRSQDGATEVASSESSEDVGLFDVVALFLEESATEVNWFFLFLPKCRR